MSKFNMENADIAWCPGCGDFIILKILKEAFTELDVSPNELVCCSGIGQAAKTPHYLTTNVFNGLHGRALGPAFAMKASSNELKVVVTSGDGDMYGEGGNHFLHTIRKNPDITVLVFNNMVYGLTKGQASPTSMIGFETPIQNKGVFNEPFNPLATAISQDASFVARAFCQDQQQTKEIIKKAIEHKGFSLVDIFQPCVTFNKLNTYQWFKENTYYLEDSYNPNDKEHAFKRAIECEKLPLGVFYVNTNKPVFSEAEHVKNICNKDTFARRQGRSEKLKALVSSYK